MLECRELCVIQTVPINRKVIKVKKQSYRTLIERMIKSIKKTT